LPEAKRLDADRKHQAEVAWARRLLEDRQAGPTAGRQAIPKSVRHSVWQRDRGRCMECGACERLEFDHIIPLAMGGANTERNLQLLCGPCPQKGRHARLMLASQAVRVGRSSLLGRLY
jgi:5-methylcytosine-specific restriction endonuclease McrA